MILTVSSLSNRMLLLSDVCSIALLLLSWFVVLLARVSDDTVKSEHIMSSYLSITMCVGMLRRVDVLSALVSELTSSPITCQRTGVCGQLYQASIKMLHNAQYHKE